MTYHVLAIQFQVLLWLQFSLRWFLGEGWIDSFGDVGKDLLRSKHSVGVQAGIVMVAGPSERGSTHVSMYKLGQMPTAHIPVWLDSWW